MSTKHTPVETFDCEGCRPFCYGGYHMKASEGGLGDYVKAEDYRTVEAQRDELLAVLIEARRWIGDGECSDGLAREHWTQEYRAAVDRIDAAIAKVTGEQT